MATVFDQVYKQAKKDLYAQQATLTRERLSRIPTSDLIAELLRAEANINMHHEKEDIDEIARLLLPHLRTSAEQDVTIIKEVMELRARLLTERAEQLRQQIERATQELATSSELFELLRPYLKVVQLGTDSSTSVTVE